MSPRGWLNLQLLWSGLLAAVALSVTYKPGPASKALPLFFCTYLLATVGARLGLRWFLGIALLQLLTMWVAFTSFVVLQLYAAVFTDLYIDSPATSIVALIYLTPTLIPATTFLWGFCQHRRKIEETLRGKSLAV